MRNETLGPSGKFIKFIFKGELPTSILKQGKPSLWVKYVCRFYSCYNLEDSVIML